MCNVPNIHAAYEPKHHQPNEFQEWAYSKQHLIWNLFYHSLGDFCDYDHRQCSLRVVAKTFNRDSDANTVESLEHIESAGAAGTHVWRMRRLHR